MKDRTNLIITLVAIILIIFLVKPLFSGKKTETPAPEAVVDEEAKMMEEGEGTVVTLPAPDASSPVGITNANPSSTLTLPAVGSNGQMTVRAFFNNLKNDPTLTNCGKVYPVIRTVAKTPAAARAALAELLRGPNTSEQKSGYTTSLNPGIVIQQLTINDGVAKVDFNQTLQTGVTVSGACRATAIRAQITETLKQFTTVSQVMISINGQTEGTL